jgi:hypothetical protein
VSATQIAVKVRDWQWAGRMTADGARLVDSALAPACGSGRVVFLTEPVAIRSVYTHFLYETFELPRGCMPGVFQVVARLVRTDAQVDVTWDGPSRLMIRVQAPAAALVVSRDLRHFDTPVDGPVALDTPLGRVTAERAGGTDVLTLELAPGITAANTQFFYYSASAIRGVPLPRPAEPARSGTGGK